MSAVRNSRKQNFGGPCQLPRFYCLNKTGKVKDEDESFSIKPRKKFNCKRLHFFVPSRATNWRKKSRRGSKNRARAFSRFGLPENSNKIFYLRKLWRLSARWMLQKFRDHVGVNCAHLYFSYPEISLVSLKKWNKKMHLWPAIRMKPSSPCKPFFRPYFLGGWPFFDAADCE